MLTLYFSKGSSAVAAHILLEETGVAYSATEIPIAEGAHRTSEFLAINPKGRLPALQTPQGIITENPAILEFIAASVPDAGLLPPSLYQQTQARMLSAYLCATVHVAFAHGKRGDRWTDDAVAMQTMRDKTPRNLAECAALLETHLVQGPWALGPDYSYCDPYLFLVGGWLAAHGLSLDPYPKLSRHAAAMEARPTTRSVMAKHGLA